MAEMRATATLPAKTYGKTLKRGTTGAWKLARPIQMATPMPMKKPRIAPTAPMAAASAAKNPLTNRSEAPRAFIMAKARGRSKTQHVRSAFHDLADGSDVGRGQKLRELAHEALNFRGGAIGGDFDGRGRDAGPVLKFRLIEIDAAVL